MHKIKYKIIYVFTILIMLSLLFPFRFSLAADSVYVWSNSSDAVPASEAAGRHKG